MIQLVVPAHQEVNLRKSLILVIYFKKTKQKLPESLNALHTLMSLCKTTSQNMINNINRTF